MAVINGKVIEVVSDSTVSVPALGALVLAANPKRYYALIVNTSNTPIWLGFGSQNAAGQGVYVAPGGFAYEIDRNNLYQKAIYAAHAGSGSKDLNVTEGS